MSTRPMDSFLCPYCFKKIDHRYVHFRSSRVDTDSTVVLPQEYDVYDSESVERFEKRYTGDDKQLWEQRLRGWRRFSPRPDEYYEEFWKNHGGIKTEVDPLKEYTNIDCYMRPVINPNRITDREFLVTQEDGGVLKYDRDGMVTSIYIKDGKGGVVSIKDGKGYKECTDRVCPHCHNPLPDNYGKYPIKFVVVIGAMGSGKTIYLSQLLKNMTYYLAKIGITPANENLALQKFYKEDNRIGEGVPLPAPTPVMSFQQPLFYDLSRTVNGAIKIDTLVLYDIAGEVFQNQALIQQFTHSIKHSDAFIMLISPNDLRLAEGLGSDDELRANPLTVLQSINNTVHDGLTMNQCVKPLAVCISKAETDIANRVFEAEKGLQELLLGDVHEVTDANGWPEQQFNAEEYDEIAQKLNRFMKEHERAISQYLSINYRTYAYFGFSALNCVVEDDMPNGRIDPRRIEEPLFWLLNKLDIIGVNGSYTEPNISLVKCPNCGNYNNSKLTGDDTIFKEKTFFGLRMKEYEVNRKCNSCGYAWYNEDEK